MAVLSLSGYGSLVRWSPFLAPPATIATRAKRPDRWTIRTALDRLEQRGDPFRTLLGVSQELPEIR
jgi:DNA primase